MELFTALLALCERNPSETGGINQGGPVMQSFDVFCGKREPAVITMTS